MCSCGCTFAGLLTRASSDKIRCRIAQPGDGLALRRTRSRTVCLLRLKCALSPMACLWQQRAAVVVTVALIMTCAIRLGECASAFKHWNADTLTLTLCSMWCSTSDLSGKLSFGCRHLHRPVRRYLLQHRDAKWSDAGSIPVSQSWC